MDRSAIREWTLRVRKLLVPADRGGGRAGGAGEQTAHAAALTDLLRLVVFKMLAVRDHLDAPIERCLRAGGVPELDGLIGLDGARRQDRPAERCLSAVAGALDDAALEAAWQPGNEEALGWVYQYFSEPEIEVYHSQRPPKVRADHVAMKTQLFTPRWIVESLLHNTLGRLWCRMHPDSVLRDRLSYLVAPADDAPPVALRSVRELAVVDPACGTMHFGLVAFNLLVEMYREEISRAGERGWCEVPPVEEEREIPSAIFAHNLFGMDIDARALRVARAALWLRARALDARMPPPRMYLDCADALFPDAGSVGWRFDVVVTNPPYLDTRDFDAALKSRMQSSYPASKRNLYAAFLERCAAMLADGGRLGLITPQTFMFISSFKSLRAKLREQMAIETLAQAGLGTFAEAVVDAAFYVMRREPDPLRRQGAIGTYLRLVKEPDSESKRAACERALADLRAGRASPVVYRYRQGDFDDLPGGPWVYWITPRLRSLFRELPRFADVARPVVGLQTSDNFRFLRCWWEVFTLPPEASRSRLEDNTTIAFGCRDCADALASSRKWFPHIKGGDYRRWHGNQEHVVNWSRDGAEIKALGVENGRVASRPQNTGFYFRPGVTWTHTSSRGLSVRVLPPGFICNVEGMAAFQNGEVGSSLETLAILNSAFARHTIDLLNPTVHFGGREVGDLPYPRAGRAEIRALEALVGEAIELARVDSVEDETTFDFVAPPAWATGAQDGADRRVRLAAIEQRIDEAVYDLYGIGQDDRTAIEADLSRSRRTTAARTSAAREPQPCAFAAERDHDTARRELARVWISYAVGIVLGRFRIGAAGAVGRGRFTEESACALRRCVIDSGIAPVDADHEDDLATAVMRALESALGPAAASGVLEAGLGASAEPAALLRRYLERAFYKRHLRQYRHRPVYWLLQSPKRHISVYVHHDRMSREVLSQIRSGHCVAGKPGPTAPERADLEAFDRALGRVLDAPDDCGRPVGWQLEIDDGVLINVAPLRELMPAWWTEPARCWRQLEAGVFDWSYTARRYWPGRVREQCRRIKSIALAHDRPDIYSGGC